MRKTFFTLCLLLVWSLAVVGQTESTSSATITFFRTPSSLLSGKFAVAAGDTVQFARGNLQYLASQNIWRFAEHQYDMIGNAAGNTTGAAYRSTQGYWIDLFGWGTSGWNSGATAYQPWDVSETNSHYCPAMAYETNWSESESTRRCDWGVNNFTSALDAGYCVLTAYEWEYILSGRTNCANLMGLGTLYGVHGFYLLPDGWDWTKVATEKSAASFTWTAGSTKFTSNVIRNDPEGRALWGAMEAKGAVFLPAGGYRLGTTVTMETLYYATSTMGTGSNYCASLEVTQSGLIRICWECRRLIGRNVRLARHL